MRGIAVQGAGFVKPQLCELTVRVTSDHLGESMSIAKGDEVMLQIPMEPLRDMIKVVKK